MKTVFQLETFDIDGKPVKKNHTLQIIGTRPKSKPYISISIPGDPFPIFVSDRDMERLAVNILKALNSKHLKQSK